MAAQKHSMVDRSAGVAAAVWTVIIASLAVWGLKNERTQNLLLLKHQAVAFFQEIVTTRSWNAFHGGVYVPVTAATQPNPYLKIPDRDVVTRDGTRLTKINPAYMTRQIAEIAEKKNLIRFHITSDNPIRPENAPDPWEMKALAAFAAGADEYSGVAASDRGAAFRYMAPLWTESACLACHAAQGYRKGDLRGGISVTIPTDSVFTIQNNITRHMLLAYAGIWGLGLLGLLIGHRLLKKEEMRRVGVIAELERSMAEIKTLSGLLPICSICKRIRDDKGYWNQLEAYISEHSQAEFSHGICRECAGKHYPDLDIYDD